MPIAREALSRRRKLLGMTMLDVAVTAGISQATLQRIESGDAPEGGGRTGIDVLMRIAEALQMSPSELMVMPTGNRWQRAVAFAANNHAAEAAPHLHTRSRSVKADAYRRLTGGPTAHDTALILNEEPDATALDEAAVPHAAPASPFVRDPSSE